MRGIKAGILAALALALIAGCGGLRARGGGELPRNVEEVDTFVVNREEAVPVRAVPDSAPALEEPVISGIPETESAAADAHPETVGEEAISAEIAATPGETPPAEPPSAAPGEIAAVPPPAKEMPPASKEDPAPAASTETRYIPGFRVQVLASQSPDEARVFAENLRSRIEEKVYVEYLAPYYKVRVGDCASRSDANLLLRRIREAGFDQAWIAETLVVKRAGKRP